MKPSIALRNHVNSPEMRGVCHRSERSTPSPTSDSSVGSPISNAKFPGCTPKKYSSSSAGLRAARARLPAIVMVSLAAAGRKRKPTDPETIREVPIGQAAFRLVARVVQAAAELERDVRPRQLFVEECGDVLLVHRRRQGLCADGLEVPVAGRKAHRTRQPPVLPVPREQVEVERVVREVRADLGALELVVLVAPHAKRGPIGVEEAAEVLAATPQGELVALRRQLDHAPLDDGHAIPHVVVAVTAADIVLVGRPRQAHVGRGGAPLRVVDVAVRRAHVAVAVRRAAGMQRPAVVAPLHVTGARRLRAPRCRSRRRTRPGTRCASSWGFAR